MDTFTEQFVIWNVDFTRKLKYDLQLTTKRSYLAA